MTGRDTAPQPQAAEPVATVRGEVTARAELGPTLMHEHVFVLNPEIADNYATEWHEATMIDEAVARLDEAYAAGIRTIVDLTVLGLGRHLPRVQQVAERTTMNIVVATGIYTYNDLPLYFQTRGPGTPMGGPDPLTEMFVRDVLVGIRDTDVRAAILKCATDAPGLTADVERSLRAVARAHLETGVPITTHTHAATRRGLDQQRVFREEGVDLGRVVIGHCGDTTDIDYLRRLMDAGSYIGMDRFGLDLYLPTAPRVETVVRLCELGYADRLVLSHDASCFTHNFDPAFKAERLPGGRGPTSHETCCQPSGAPASMTRRSPR